ncbi:MAG: site-specific integrase [Candidatus Obscuribacterales bacterium]|nr:site-specific integrase [Candidatus Obscuribacterales bacterium]
MTKENKSNEKVNNGLYKRGNNWCIRIMINGILHRKSIGPEKAKAKAVLAELKSQRALFRVTGDMSGLEEFFKIRERKTFAEVAEAYIAERPHLKPSTLRGYREILKNYLLPTFGKLYVDQITEDQIARFQADISQSVSATRTNNILGPLRYILKTCVRRKLIGDNPALYVSQLREEDPNIDPLTADELDKVITCMKPYQQPLFLCLAWTGARPDELFALRWSDIDFQRNEIHINKGRVRGLENTTKTKSSKRVIYMLSVVRQILSSLHASSTKHLNGYVFLNKHGQPYDKHVDREWRIALSKAGVRHRPAYQLRHTFASQCLQNGLQPTWVSKMLGHSSLQTTFKHYARFIDDASNINEKRLEEFLSNRNSSNTRASSS